MGVAAILCSDWLYPYSEEYSSRADGFFEHLLKSINTFVKYHGGPQHIISEAKDFLALLEAFKKEFKVTILNASLPYRLFALRLLRRCGWHHMGL